MQGEHSKKCSASVEVRISALLKTSYFVAIENVTECLSTARNEDIIEAAKTFLVELGIVIFSIVSFSLSYQ